MKIFIGSSQKNIETAKKTADALEADGFTVYRWWDKKVFKTGDITLSRLIEMSDICHGAVFIFGEDDEIIVSTKNGKKTMQAPRDNVVLEYGIFVSKNGIDKTLIITTDSNINMPSDLKGIGYSEDDLEGLIDSLKIAFQKKTLNNENNITAHMNLKLINSLSYGGERAWRSRKLYLGEDGAQLWKNVEECQNYRANEQFKAVHKSLSKLLKELDMDKYYSVISFGPGLGKLDSKIIPTISSSGYPLDYIPIDINIYLATFAAENVTSLGNVYVPFCVIGDFENGMKGIIDTIHKHTTSGRVFLMLGGTFGNLEEERPFLHSLKELLEEDDIAILDIFSTDNDYRHEDDPLYNLNSIKSDAVKKFIAKGVDINEDKVIDLEDLNSYVSVNKLLNDSSSDIPDTFAFDYKCSNTERSIITVRRYNHDSFHDYLEDNGFVVLGSDIVKTNKLVNHSIFIVEKKL